MHLDGDVVICPPQDGGTEVQVISQTPPRSDDLMTLRVLEEDDDAGRVVRVVDSRPVIVAGQLRHEVQLQQTSPPVETGAPRTPETE